MEHIGLGAGEQVASDKELQVHHRRGALVPIISHYQANHTMQIAALKRSWPSGLEKPFLTGCFKVSFPFGV